MKKLKHFFTWLLFPFILIIKKRQPKIKAKIEEITDNYNELIKEYELIQRKESKLPKAKRDEVIQRVAFLVMKEHIKVN